MKSTNRKLCACSALMISLTSCINNQRYEQLHDALGAADFESKSDLFAPTHLDLNCIMSPKCTADEQHNHIDSLRHSGAILSFIIAESLSTDTWHPGYTEHLNYWSKSDIQEFRFAMIQDAEQERGKINPSLIKKPGFKIYKIASCSDTASYNEITTHAQRNELIGECISFTGLRCDSLMSKCLVTTVLSKHTGQGASYWMLLKKENNRWINTETFDRSHWD